MKRLLVFAMVVMIVVIAVAPAFALTTIIESRVAGGAKNALFTFSGLATTSAKSTAAGLTGTGSYYAGQTTPAKWGEWSFTPTITGYYNVAGTWATNAYASGTLAPTWTVNNAGTAVSVTLAQTSGANAWNTLATGKKFNAGTAYATRLTTNPDSIGNKRTYFDSVRWVSSTPTAVTNTGPADLATGIALTGAANDLTWTKGNYNSFFDVWFGLSAGSLVKVASDVAETTLTWDPESAGPLAGGTTYFWKVTAKNVDLSADGAVFSFTTAAVPEPASMLALGTGLIGLLGLVRRRRA